MIERVVGYRPPTCPWRAYYDPLVREVMSVSWAIENGNLPAIVTEDTPAVLVDAIGIYRMALLATIAEDRRLNDPKNTTG